MKRLGELLRVEFQVQMAAVTLGCGDGCDGVRFPSWVILLLEVALHVCYGGQACLPACEIV